MSPETELPYITGSFPESLTTSALSIAVVGPDDTLRKAVVKALAGCHDGIVREFSSYPPGLDDLPQLLAQRYDIVMIELDNNPEYALDLVEGICASGSSTVMVYSNETDPEESDPELLKRCMRAGAREFLSMPFATNSITEALVRSAARRPPARAGRKVGGRFLVFCGAKGGAGVTALACNFALALARESSANTLLIDLDLPLGDVAINLGITAHYSTIDALQNYNRLDSSFLSKILTLHSSGLTVLTAPGSASSYRPTAEAVDRLLTIARQDYENVVVDAGSKFDSSLITTHFSDASTVYLVTQSGIPELRNANRLISQCFSSEVPKLEIVLNRYESRGSKISDDDIRKALTRSVAWKIPNDYSAIRKMQDTASPVALADSFIGWQITQMARSACGLPEIPQKKKGFSFKTLGRSGPGKNTVADENPGILRLGLITGGEDSETSAQGFGLNGRPDSRSEGIEEDLYLDQQRDAEIRSYNGLFYLRGVDGRWSTQAPSELERSEEIPSLEWPTPEPISYGTVLSESQLSATASVPGRLFYTPSAGYVLPAGAHTLWATFIPDDAGRKIVVQASVVLTVSKAMPVIRWPRPSAISFGTPLSALQLNASASTPGTFEYIPGEGDVPNIGVQSLLVAFNPTDAANYLSAQAEVPLTVTKAATTLTWPAPKALSYGTQLGAEQLNAVASVPGTFIYSPAVGTILAAGKHTLSVAFTPADPTSHTAAQTDVTISVTKAVPAIKWNAPHSISYGTPLSAAELCARSSVAGSLVYIPGEGAVLAAGKHNPSAIFTPADTANYVATRVAVTLTVTKAVPTITWSAPEPLPYGSPLTSSELNASASIPGMFIYEPELGTILKEGKHVLTANFTPIDVTNYATVSCSVTLAVAKATPITIQWATPEAISYGTPLSAAQLNATASVPGKFTYSHAEGDVLTAGKHGLVVTFAPADSNLPVTKASVEQIVSKARPVVTWSAPHPIAYGTRLSSVQLNAVASVPGMFSYNPTDGTVPKAGVQRLAATFTPADVSNYESIRAEVSLSVTKAVPAIVWPSPSPITYGTPLGASQLNATASIAGKFIYAPAAGTVLTAATHTLSVSFIPGDSETYATVQATVSIVVNELSSIAFIESAASDVDGEIATPILLDRDVEPVTPKREIEKENDSRPLPVGNGVIPLPQAPVAAKKNVVSMTRGTAEANSTPETRTYKGAVYTKGPDGQWHLQRN